VRFGGWENLFNLILSTTKYKRDVNRNKSKVSDLEVIFICNDRIISFGNVYELKAVREI